MLALGSLHTIVPSGGVWPLSRLEPGLLSELAQTGLWESCGSETAFSSGRVALKGQYIPRTWLSVMAFGGMVFAGVFLLCPPNLFHSRYPGRSYLMERPRFLMAASGTTGRLAVSIQYQGKVRIYVDKGNTYLTPVTCGILDADPAWDPTGTLIAYVSLGNHARLSLRIRNLADGSDSELLQDKLISQPIWSNDGKHIFFLRSRSDTVYLSTIRVVDLKTRRTIDLAETAYPRPQVWGLMDENQAIYVHDGAVWAKPIGQRAERMPISFSNPCMVSISPNNRLLFVCDSLAAKDKLAVLVDMREPQSRKTIYRGYIRHVLWSPSGEFLAIAGENDTQLFRASKVASADGWRFLATLKGIAVSWRSDSKLIFVRPDKRTPYFLEEDDLLARSTIRMAIVGT